MTSTLENDLEPFIQNKQWDAVVERLAAENNVSEAGGIQNNQIRHCIREALKQEDLPLHVLDALVQVCEARQGLMRYPGRILLHLATDFDVSAEIIHFLIEKYPKGAQTHDENMLPIHNAARRSTCPNVIGLLIESYPAGARRSTNTYPKALPIHYAGSNTSVEVVNRLIDAYPDGVRQTESHGWLPIHYAVKTCKSLEIVNRLIEAHPEGVRQPSKFGQLPIHMASRSSSSLTLEIVNHLIEAYPEGVRQPTKNGQLAIHVAASNRSPVALEIIKRLIEAYPEGVKKRDKEGKLPIHVAARCQENVNVIGVLIDAYPMSVVLTSPHESSCLLPSEHAIIGDGSKEVVSFIDYEEKQFLVDVARVITGRKKVGVANKK